MSCNIVLYGYYFSVAKMSMMQQHGEDVHDAAVLRRTGSSGSACCEVVKISRLQIRAL
jgi:hypothetical protein